MEFVNIINNDNFLNEKVMRRNRYLATIIL